MKDKNKDWLQEVWRIKEDLSKEAKKIGLNKYLEQAEKRAEQILARRPNLETSIG